MQLNKSEVALTPKPIHQDIAKYGYYLQYSPSKDVWYAAYDADKGTVWYKWDGNEFVFLFSNYILPDDLTSNYTQLLG